MTAETSAQLPTSEHWRFDAIAAEEPARARALECAGTRTQLLDAISEAFGGSLNEGRARFGREPAEDARGGHRAVIQFHVGGLLFDWFFNGRSGYRAHYWAHPRVGIAFNDEVIGLLRATVTAILPASVAGFDIVGKFANATPVLLDRAFLEQSLLPTWSKVWWCVNRLRSGGGIEQIAPGLIGPRLEVGRRTPWAAPAREDADAWLDVYGAFVGTSEPYQPKDPFVRAEGLHQDGRA